MPDFRSVPDFLYTIFPPSGSLRDYIDFYWEFKLDTVRERRFIIVPDGRFDLILTIRNNQILSNKLTGIWDKNIEVIYTSSCRLIGVRFKPVAVRIFLGQSIADFLNTSVSFDTEFFKINRDLFLDSEMTLQVFSRYFDNIFERLLISERIDRRQIKLYNHIDCAVDSLTVDELSNNFGLSARQIHRIVSYDLGISPKTYIQIIKVKKLLEKINRGNLNPDNSFFDQSHLIRNIKRFTGLSPRDFAAFKNVRFVQFQNQ